MIRLIAPKGVVLKWLDAQQSYWEAFSSTSPEQEWARYAAIGLGQRRLRKGLRVLFRKTSVAELYVDRDIGWNDRETLFLDHWHIYLNLVRPRMLSVIQEARTVALSVPDGTPWPYRATRGSRSDEGEAQQPASSDSSAIHGDSSSLRKSNVRKLATSLARGRTEFDARLVRGALDELAFAREAIARIATRHDLAYPHQTFDVALSDVLDELQRSPHGISVTTARSLVNQERDVWNWLRVTGAELGPTPNVLSREFETALRDWQSGQSAPT